MNLSYRITEFFMRRPHWLFGLTVTLFYISLSPVTIEGQGYNSENIAAAHQLATNIANAVSRQPLEPMTWTRHGGIELIFELPFVLLSRLLFGSSLKWVGPVMLLQPILATSLLCTLVFAWAQQMTKSRRWSFVLASCAAFSTMLQPYAYIGLETTQSLALLTAGYLALGRPPRHTWNETMVFALCCCCAISVKTTGIFLLPAVAYLILTYIRAESVPFTIKSRAAKIITIIAVVLAVYSVNSYLKESYYSNIPGGSAKAFTSILVDNPLVALMQAFSFFGSANKSLLIYAPVTLLGLLRLPQTYRIDRRLAIFTLLVLAGLVGGFSLVTVWTEETWGPRYLHSAIAPTILCLAAAKSPAEFRWRSEKLLLAAAIIGAAISLLGSIFPYGHLHYAAMKSSQSTLEALQYDPAWNHVGFNLKLLLVACKKKLGRASAPEIWPPARHWWFEPPTDAPTEKTVDLREFSYPQPLILKDWSPKFGISRGFYVLLRIICVICLSFSLITLTWECRRP